MFRKILAMVLSVLFIVLLPACSKEKEDDYDFTNENANGFYDEKEDMNNEVENPNSEISVQSVSAKKIEPSTDGFIIPVETVSEVPENYIGIYSIEDLDNIRYNLNANYILMRDLDLSDETIFNPIEGFLGVFDGNGHKVRGIKCLSLGLTKRNVGANILSVGLFASAAEIKNLAIENIDIKITNLNEINIQQYNLNHSSIVLYVGAIAAQANKISNCYVTGRIAIEKTEVPLVQLRFGSIVGDVQEIYTSYSSCTLSVGDTDYDYGNIGGICGSAITVSKCFYDSQLVVDCIYKDFEGYYNFNNGAEIYAGGVTGYVKDRVSDSYNEGKVSIQKSDAMILVSVGGIAGMSNGIIERCYNTGSIGARVCRNDSKGCYVGGIVGKSPLYNYSGSYYVTESYNTGYISGEGICETYIGGIIGECDRGESIFNCFNKGSVFSTGTNESVYAGGIAGNNMDEVYNCYNIGGVASTGGIGAICGGFQSDVATIENCYYNNTDLNGVASRAMFATVKQLDDKSFQKANELKGFKFAEDSEDAETAVWIYFEGKNNGYPILKNTFFEEK